MKTTGPRCSSKQNFGRHACRKKSWWPKEERREERLQRAAETKAREENGSYVLRMLVLERLTSVIAELKKVQEDHYSSTVSWQPMQKELEQVRRKLGEKDVLIESVREAAKTRARGEGGKKEGAER